MAIRDFFAQSDAADYLVVRPLSHIRANWELRWDTTANGWAPEEGSYAQAFNVLV